jgi:resuscitation-promoting factor RpfA
MRKSTHQIRASALPAIAAALALSSTSALAQQVQPVPADPAPVTTPAPATTPPAATTVDQSAPAAIDQSSTTDTSATQTSTPATHAVRTVKHTTRIATAKNVPVTHTAVPATHTVVRTAQTRTATHATPPAAPVAARPAAQSTVKPLVNLNSTPASAKPAAAPTRTPNNPMLIAGAGVLALLIIAAAAFALMRRRRRVAEDAWIDEEPMQYEPAETAMVNEPEPAPIGNEEQPPIVAPAASAFAWGDDASSRAGEESMVEDERQPGESWIERAYRGPSPSNPSVSLKARLRRAAFFDKRERDAAAGKAEPLDTSAGLPDALVREQEDELA